jgi:predicted metal-dependent phosphoesterase TrpH
MTLKVELHAHTDADPIDRIFHDARQLIDRAAALGYQALAITLHDRWFDPTPVSDHAASRGVTLIPAIEQTIEGAHVLLINVPREVERVSSFADLQSFKAATGALVIAPHPFYPISSAMGPRLDRLGDLVDALEINSLHARGIDFNRRAAQWAAAHDKPLVGNTDLHLLAQMGTTYSLVDAEAATPEAICQAIRIGRVQVVTRPIGWLRAGLYFTVMVAGSIGRRHE